MTREELIEKVAREICSRNGYGPEVRKGVTVHSPGGYPQWNEFVDDATAAIDIITEACASLEDTVTISRLFECGEKAEEGYEQALNDFATAIRGLGKE